MTIVKRDGSREPVDVNRITRVVETHSEGLDNVDPLRVATKTIGGLYDGASTSDLDQLSIQAAAAMTGEEPQYARLAARLLAKYIGEEVRQQGILSFADSVRKGHVLGIVSDRLLQTVEANEAEFNALIAEEGNQLFEYFGLKTVYDRYLLRHPQERKVIETPQQFFLRVAVSLTESLEEATALYQMYSRLEYLPSSPTLFNAGTRHEQLSSCFLLDSPEDHLSSIYKRYTDIALLSKFSGGIGVAYHRVRSRGSLIESTNGHSNGIIPWLKTLDASVAAVNQGGKRKGACCVYLEPWHADVEEFLELRDNTGDEARRTHNLNLANWVCDLFMQRVEKNEMWSLFDPKVVPEFPDLYGEAFESAYTQAEKDGKAEKQINARELYGRMIRTLAQTGNGWMTFKDKCNRACNQTALPGRTVHLSNLCTEIIEVTNNEETAVCNLGSLNLSKYISGRELDWEKLRRNVRTAVRALDRVIDLNFYPIPSTASSNSKWRPIGLGVMGLQDVFFRMKEAFDSPYARELNQRIFEEIYFAALETSCDLAEEKGAHPAFQETRAARGELQFDHWGVGPKDKARWDALRERIKQVGLRNSLLMAVAPTATIASIAGC